MLTKCKTRTVGFSIGEGRLCYKDPMRAERWVIPNTVTDNIMEREDGTAIINSAGAIASSSTALSSLTDVNIAAPAGGELLIYDGVNSWDNLAMSGDATISSAGVVAIAGDSIVNADVNTAAAIAFSKLAALTSAQILVGSAGNVATAVAVSGDASITNAGVVSVTDLTITGEVQGNILYFNGSNWVRLAVGTAGQSLLTNGAGANPSWGTPTLAGATVISNNCTLNDAGANDAILSFTTQTVSAPTLTVPNFAGVNDTFAFITLAQTLVNKTLTSPVLTTPQINDTSADHQYIFAVSELAADRTVTLPLLAGNDVFVFADFTQTLTNKTLSGNVCASLVFSAGGNAITFQNAVHTVVGRDTTDTLTNKTLNGNVCTSLVFSAGGNAITFQNAVHTVIGRDTTDTLTNKSINADGTGNVITNINANELDPITFGASTFGIPFIVTYSLSNQAAAVNVFGANCPFKLRVIRAWSIATSADGGTWKLNNGALGVGTDITNAVSVAANDNDYDEPTDYDDAAWEIAANGSLSVVPDGAGVLDCMIFIECMRVD